ncbi:alpha/beta fold hydrolase [Paucibacter sp. APW11]|uniref:Alpha/beta fold hydrolase n=1 Tax=Roseateles aquae TaxID=3077235 RepID=A0ABU3P560_9BURK|nr:PHB depolymerase family esterase [Paucibacter sp. APW11]MDT8997715.1 alpha/beta fold hydrolase [Paucibacter sp. APW11]
MVGGTLRRFDYFVPQRLAPGAAMLLVFHGGSGSPAQIRRFTDRGFEAIAQQDGAIVVYPAGVGGNWNSCQKGRKNVATQRNVDELGFVQAMVDWFAAQHQIDTKRVYAFGYSNGGHLCFRLAQALPERLAGVVAVAANRPAASDSKCPMLPVSVPVLIINGTADPINPFGGGELSPYGLRRLGPVLSALETAASFAPAGSLLRRSGRAQARADWVERYAWQLGGRDQVVLLLVHGGGHTIPQPLCKQPWVFGRTSTAIDAMAESWKFFKGLPARRVAGHVNARPASNGGRDEAAMPTRPAAVAAVQAGAQP